MLVTTRANPPLTIFGNEYVFSTFHYPTDPNAGKAHREEYARKVGLDILISNIRYEHYIFSIFYNTRILYTVPRQDWDKEL